MKLIKLIPYVLSISLLLIAAYCIFCPNRIQISKDIIQFPEPTFLWWKVAYIRESLTTIFLVLIILYFIDNIQIKNYSAIKIALLSYLIYEIWDLVYSTVFLEMNRITFAFIYFFFIALLLILNFVISNFNVLKMLWKRLQKIL